MAFKKTVFFLFLMLSPVAMTAKRGVLLDKLSATFNDAGNNKTLGEQLQDDIKAIQIKLDDLSAKAALCRQARCPTSWVKHGVSCYYINDTATLKMMDARNECQSMGGDLPIIKSAEEDAFLLDLMNNQTTVTKFGGWIGLVRKAADSEFYWIDDTPLEGQGQYKSWSRREPNNLGGNEDCANKYANIHDRKWNDFPCEFEANHQETAPVVLCQKPL